MAPINARRVWLGTLVGGIVFFIWSMIAEFGLAYAFVGRERMEVAVTAGWFLKEPRIPIWLFFAVWILCLFAITYGLARAYVALRASLGAGPVTALKIGALVGFAGSFPLEFAHAVFQPLSARYAVVWILEVGLGCVFAALTAGWLYRDAPAGG